MTANLINDQNSWPACTSDGIPIRKWPRMDGRRESGLNPAAFLGIVPDMQQGNYDEALKRSKGGRRA
jgi:hypothetical protein